MDRVSLNPTTAAIEATLLRNAETDTAKSVALLKKALEADKSLVETLLPTLGHRVDIKA